MFPDEILIRGAKEHNLKNIDVTIPRNRMVVITGVSGSGKSSLAFDTIFAEGQRRYVESLSAYARQFLGQMDKPRRGLYRAVFQPRHQPSTKRRTSQQPPLHRGHRHRDLRLPASALCPRGGASLSRSAAASMRPPDGVQEIVDLILALDDGSRLLFRYWRRWCATAKANISAHALADAHANRAMCRARIDGRRLHDLDEPRRLALDRYKMHDHRGRWWIAWWYAITAKPTWTRPTPSAPALD